MSLIEGIGDEVLLLVGAFILVVLLVVMWGSTRVAEYHQRIHVIVLDANISQRLIRRLQTVAGLPGRLVQGSARENNAAQTEMRSMESIQTANDLISDSSLLQQRTDLPNSELVYQQNVFNSTLLQPSDKSTSGINANSETVLANESRDNESVLPSGSHNNGESVLESAVSGPNEDGNTAGEEGMRIRLKYFDDRQKEVRARPEETVGEFKRKHFTPELAQNLVIRFIYNGQELRQDASTLRSYNVVNDSVIHCLLTHLPTSTPPAHGTSNNWEFDIGRYMIPLFGVLLGLLWYCRVMYRAYFNVASTISLFGISFLFIVLTMASIHGRGTVVHDHRE